MTRVAQAQPKRTVIEKKRAVFLAPFLGSLCMTLFCYGLSALTGTGAGLGGVILGLALFPNFFLLIHSVMIYGERTFGLLIAIYDILYLILPGMFQAAIGQFPFYSFGYSDNTITMSAFLILLFSSIFVICYLWSVPEFKNGPVISETASNGDINIKSTLIVLALFYTVGIVSFVTLGAHTYLTRLAEIESADSSPLRLVQTSLGRVAGFEALAISSILLRRSRTPDTRLLFGLIWATAFALFFVLNYPLNVTRYFFFGWVIALGYIFINSNKRRIKLFICAIFFVGSVSIFPLLSNLSRGEIGSKLLNPIDYLTTSGDLDSFQSTMNVYEMVDTTGIGWGRHLLSSVLFFVPREYWPTKPYSTGTEAAHFRGYAFTNISAPLPSEFYVDFGWIGVLLGSAALAFACRRLDLWSQIANRGRKFQRLLVGTVVGFVIIIMRGPLLGIIGPVSMAILASFVVFSFCRTSGAKKMVRKLVSLNR